MKGGNMKSIIQISIAICFVLLMAGVQPGAAWGGLTHEAIISMTDNNTVRSYPGFAKGGSVGTDMFYFIGDPGGYSGLAHTDRTIELPRNMLNLSISRQQRAYSYGMFAHYASDIRGHKYFINTF